MSILQVTAEWTGFTGAPGYTNLYFTNAGIITTAVDNAVAAVHDFFDGVKAILTSAEHIQVSQEVKELDPASGALIALHSAGSTPAPVVGTLTALGPGPAGVVVSWGTGGVNRGKRVRGRTFLVPVSSAAFDTDGTLTSGCLSIVNSAATAYRTSAAYETLVWSRPRAGAGGAAFPITSHHVPDMAAVLRSRRD